MPCYLSYWVSGTESSAEERVLQDPSGLGLVYGQVVAEVQLGWLTGVSHQQQQQLAQLQARGHKRQVGGEGGSRGAFIYVMFISC